VLGSYRVCRTCWTSDLADVVAMPSPWKAPSNTGISLFPHSSGFGSPGAAGLALPGEAGLEIGSELIGGCLDLGLLVLERLEHEKHTTFHQLDIRGSYQNLR